MQPKPDVIFPDVEEWAVSYIAAQIAALDAAAEVDDETYTYTGLRVLRIAPDAMPDFLVTVRDDGGPRLATVTKICSLGVNVYGTSHARAGDLARLVAYLLEQAPGNGAVVAHSSTAGPAPVAEASEKPHLYLSVDLMVRGASL